MHQGNQSRPRHEKLAEDLISYREEANGSCLRLLDEALAEYQNMLVHSIWSRLDAAIPGLMSSRATDSLVSIPLADGDDIAKAGILCNDPHFKSFCFRWSGAALRTEQGATSSKVMVCLLVFHSEGIADLHIRSAPTFAFTPDEWRSRLEPFSSLKGASNAGYLCKKVEGSRDMEISIETGEHRLQLRTPPAKKRESIVLLLERLDSLLRSLQIRATEAGYQLNPLRHSNPSLMRHKAVQNSQQSSSNDGVASRGTLRQVLEGIFPKAHLAWIDWAMHSMSHLGFPDARWLWLEDDAREFRRSLSKQDRYLLTQIHDQGSCFTATNNAFSQLVTTGNWALESVPRPDEEHYDQVLTSVLGYAKWAQEVGIQPAALPAWVAESQPS